MNGYAIFILCGNLAEFFLNIIGGLLNLKAIKADLPEELRGNFDHEVYGKYQAYNRISTLWDLLRSTLTVLFILIFWFSGGFNYLDHLIRTLRFGPLVSGLFYIGLLFFLSSFFSLPFIIFEIFVIEEKFGFNRTRPATFALDLLKGWGLAILLGTPILSGILYFFDLAGPSAWWTEWIVISLFLIFIQWIGPAWILPLFNQFSPLENGKLKESIIELGRQARFPIETIYVMDGSKRSSKGNAFFTGFGRHKKIAIFDTLIKTHKSSELVAILAHEIGHFKKKHVVMGTFWGIIKIGVFFYCLSLFLSSAGLSEAFYIERPSLYTNFIFFFPLYSPLGFIFSLLFLIFSRHNEFEADRYAVETLGESVSMIQALEKLAVDNLANLNPHPFHVFLKESHPPIMKRIQAIRQIRLA